MTHYPWLASTWQGLQSAMSAQRLPGAILLQSDVELGVDELIEKFSAALLCKTYPDEGCGFCHSCELLKSQNHPDLHFIRAEKEGKAITVEQIRQCNRQAQESSQMGGYRLFVIEPAEAMNESASNALLKTLEEPSGSCLFLLICHDKKRLLPTIISRCQQWSITPPEVSLSMQWLQQQGVSVNESFLKLAHYSPVTAMHMAKESEFQHYEKLERQFVDFLIQADSDYVSLCQTIQAATLRNLSWLWLLLSDAQKVHFGLQNEETLQGSHALGQLPLSGLQTSMVKLNQLNQQLHQFSGLNEELMIINWLIETREALCL